MTEPSPFQSLSLREKAAQLVFPRLGSNMPPPVRARDDAERVSELLEQLPFGGLIVFNGDVQTTPDTLQEMQRYSRFPLLIATDMEAGLGQQFAGATTFPHALAFDQLGADAPRYVQDAARVAAREALAAGVHIALAPVADVHRNPRNPIISSRAWSRDPERAGELASAYVRAVQSEGLLATAKHFPGHGGTEGDSHVELPRATDSREELERTDFRPFHACIEAGVSLVMTAHVSYPSLDPEGHPATLSRPILQRLLRDEMGFQGAIISDSMMMEGVQQEGVGVNARLLMAGADILLDPVDAVTAVEDIVLAVEEGRLAESDLDRAVQRVQALRDWLAARHGPALFSRPSGAVDGAPWTSQTSAALALEIATRAIHATDAFATVRDRLREVPRSAVFVITPSLRSAPLTSPFEEALLSAQPDARIVRLDPTAPSLEDERRQLSNAPFVIFVVFVRPAAWHTYGLSPLQHRLVTDRIREGNAALLLLANEDLAHSLPPAPTLFAHSDLAPSQQAAVHYLFDRK